jgi:hypothetical protein
VLYESSGKLNEEMCHSLANVIVDMATKYKSQVVMEWLGGVCGAPRGPEGLCFRQDPAPAPRDGGGGPQGGDSRTRTSCYPLTTGVLRLNIPTGTESSSLLPSRLYCPQRQGYTGWGVNLKSVT